MFINVWYVKTIKPSPLDKTDQNVGGFRFADVIAMGWIFFFSHWLKLEAPMIQKTELLKFKIIV